MSLIEKLKQQTIDAMKAKDKERRDALRLLSNAVNNAIKEKGTDLTENEELTILSREAKKRSEAIESYRQGGREDRAKQEQKELEIIESFLPKQLTNDEVKKRIEQIIQKTNATSPKDMGKVMKELAPQIRGTFDGKKAQQMVAERLKNEG